MPAAAAEAVQAVLWGTDAVIVRAPGMCSPEFAELLLRSATRAARPGRRLDRRDEMIRALAERYTGSTRSRALAMLRDVAAYRSTRWRFDQRWAICPKELEGTVQGSIWHILKVSPRFPGQRQLQTIIGQPPASKSFLCK
jgi:hypothetical protein